VRELSELLVRLRELDASGAPAALATVARVEGSSYRREGARMLVEPDGRLTGMLTGGCLERDLVAAAREALAAGAACALEFDLTADAEAYWGTGTGCAGRVTFLLEPLDPARRRAAIDLLASVLERRREARLATLIRPGNRPPAGGAGGEPIARAGDRIVLSIEGSTAIRPPVVSDAVPAESSPFLALPASRPGTSAPPGSSSFYGSSSSAPWISLARRALEAVASGAALAVELPGGEWVLLESIVPPVHLLVVGAERDAPALLRMARELGWAATVVEPRPSPAAEARVAGLARYVAAAPRALAGAGVELSARTAALLASHRYLDDLAFLEELAAAPLGYLGLLGPVRRRERLLDDLARRAPEAAARARRLARGPAGLALGGRSPEEVALSVVAEIQAVLSGGGGLPLGERAGALEP
jgi:xanthine dehydrogenase accessory factor